MAGSSLVKESARKLYVKASDGVLMAVYVGIAAYSGTPPLHAVEKVNVFVEKLQDYCGGVSGRIIFLVGGYEGLMKIFVDKALERGFKVVILPPAERERDDFPEEAIIIKTGVTATLRSSILVHASDFLVALGGGSGTLEEVITAHNEGKEVYILTDTGLPTDVVKVLPSRLNRWTKGNLKSFNDPEVMAKSVCEHVANSG
ncbi:MAG: hypothetical protein QXN82_04555, partial [Desulfurococcaceae archaeon]